MMATHSYIYSIEREELGEDPVTISNAKNFLGAGDMLYAEVKEFRDQSFICPCCGSFRWKFILEGSTGKGYYKVSQLVNGKYMHFLTYRIVRVEVEKKK